jgi:hypothetical protein
MVDNIGLPSSPINLTYNNTGTCRARMTATSRSPCVKGHAPTADYVRELREVLAARIPGYDLFVSAGGHGTQILNFGAPGADRRADPRARYERELCYAQQLLKRIRGIPGVADARIQQSNKAPVFKVDWIASRPSSLA